MRALAVGRVAQEILHGAPILHGQRGAPDVVLVGQQARVAFGLLVATAGAAWKRLGEDAVLAGVAAWSIPHGLAMLILDGRIPAQHIATTEAIETLARDVIQLWRNA